MAIFVLFRWLLSFFFWLKNSHLILKVRIIFVIFLFPMHFPSPRNLIISKWLFKSSFNVVVIVQMDLGRSLENDNLTNDFVLTWKKFHHLPFNDRIYYHFHCFVFGGYHLCHIFSEQIRSSLTFFSGFRLIRHIAMLTIFHFIQIWIWCYD